MHHYRRYVNIILLAILLFVVLFSYKPKASNQSLPQKHEKVSQVEKPYKNNYNYSTKFEPYQYMGEEEFVPPFYNFPTDYMISHKYKIVGCSIRKSMSQFMANSMCYLFNETQFIEDKHSFNDTWLNNRSCDTNPAFKMRDSAVQSDPNYSHFAFIRDPFERFASLYVDKCLEERRCYGCKGDMRCVVQSIYRDLRSIYYVPGARHTYDSYHVIPQSWACNFGDSFSRYKIIKIGVDEKARRAAVGEFKDIMVSKNVPKSSVDYVVDQALYAQTSHKTYASPERRLAEHQIQHDPVVRHYLHLIYYYDYKIFGLSRDKLDSDYKIGESIHSKLM